MNKLTGLLILWSLLTSSVGWSQSKVPFSQERNEYAVFFHWGFIWKQAGNGVLTCAPPDTNRNYYSARLSARSSSFFDRFVTVRDTLISTFTPQMYPLTYHKIVHEDTYFAHDDYRYSYSGKEQSVYVRYFRKQGLRNDTTFRSNRIGYDMLSVFYAVRALDLSQGKRTYPLSIYSDDQIVPLRVEYRGVSPITLFDKRKYNAHYFRLFLEIQQNEKQKIEEIELWLKDDPQRTLLQISGKLVLGSLKAVLIE